MKKLLLTVLIFGLLFALVACTNVKNSETEAVQAQPSDNVIEATPESTPMQTNTNTAQDIAKEPATVYMTKEISSEGLMKIYDKLGRKAEGKVAVKLHMGEPGGNNYLSPDLVKDFVLSVKGTFVDCNTAYGGRRANTEMHLQAAKDHGFTEYADVDILDADGTIALPVENGVHLKEDIVGSRYANYDFIILLSHFKGHAMGGFGGAIKNMSIGLASMSGKCRIHTAGKSDTSMWASTKQDDFLESMAEAAKAVADDKGDKILYISVMNNLSIDCDCDNSPAAPQMEDIGILASLDPVALDRACVDLVYAAPDGKALISRIESLNGTHTLDYAEEIGLGTQTYDLVSIDD